MSGEAYTPAEKQAYRERLELMRRFYNMNQTQFARYLGITYKKWNHYERGYPFSRETAFILHEKAPHFSLDWLYWGNPGGLTVKLFNQLEALKKDR